MENNNTIDFVLEIKATSSSHKTKEICLENFESILSRLANEKNKKSDYKKSLKIVLSSENSTESKTKTLMYLQSILFTNNQICLENSTEDFDINGHISVGTESYIIKDSEIKKKDGTKLFPTLIKRLEQAFKEQTDEIKKAPKLK